MRERHSRLSPTNRGTWLCLIVYVGLRLLLACLEQQLGFNTGDFAEN